MGLNAVGTHGRIFACFADLEDPRDDNARHDFLELLVIVLCAVLCGAEDCTDMAVFGRAKEDFFREFLERYGVVEVDSRGAQSRSKKSPSARNPTSQSRGSISMTTTLGPSASRKRQSKHWRNRLPIRKDADKHKAPSLWGFMLVGVSKGGRKSLRHGDLKLLRR